LADLLRMGRLPEAWIPPPATRELRELVRHRAKLVALRAHAKAQVHAVLAKCGVPVPMSDLFGLEGLALLERVTLPGVYRARVASLRRLIEALEFEIELFAGMARSDAPVPVAYPSSCSPQAWASATPVQLLRTLLRWDPWVPHGTAWLAPVLPDGFGDLTLTNLPLAGSRLSVRVRQGRPVEVDGAPAGLDICYEPRPATSAVHEEGAAG